MKSSRSRTRQPPYEVAVPTDFSPASTSAMKFAEGLAKVPGSRLTVMHAIDSLPYSYGPKDLRSLQKQAAWTLAQESMDRWLREGRFPDCNQILIEGEAAAAIAQFTAIKSPDMIVLGTSARRHAARLVLGSVGEEIFREATCPVFVLGPKVRASNRPLRRLLFATDLEPHSLAVLPHISKFAKRFDCTVSVIRAVHPDIKSRPERLRIKKETEQRVKAAANSDLLKRIEKIHVEFAHPLKAIAGFTNRCRANAIVMGVRGGGAWERATTHIPWALAHRVIAGVKVPVLTIRG